jgi:hypothetical protein
MGANKRFELAEKAPDAANADASDNKMDQIRELMFGGVVRDFDRRIKELGDRTESEMARVVADYELNLIAHLGSFRALSTDRVFATCGDDGVSRTSNEYALYRDMHDIRKRHMAPWRSRLYWAVGVANVVRRTAGRGSRS